MNKQQSTIPDALFHAQSTQTDSSRVEWASALQIYSNSSFFGRIFLTN